MANKDGQLNASELAVIALGTDMQTIKEIVGDSTPRELNPTDYPRRDELKTLVRKSMVELAKRGGGEVGRRIRKAQDATLKAMGEVGDEVLPGVTLCKKFVRVSIARRLELLETLDFAEVELQPSHADIAGSVSALVVAMKGVASGFKVKGSLGALSLSMILASFFLDKSPTASANRQTASEAVK